MTMHKRPLLFIDTNIFLDFYRTRGEAGLTLLGHIEKVSGLLIMTDQVEMEFLNNRQRVISTELSGIKAPSMPTLTPAYLSDSNTAVALEKNVQEIKRRIERIRVRF